MEEPDNGLLISRGWRVGAGVALGSHVHRMVGGGGPGGSFPQPPATAWPAPSLGLRMHSPVPWPRESWARRLGL